MVNKLKPDKLID